MEARETRSRITTTRVESARLDGASDTRSLGELFRELSLEGRTLVRQEVDLAKTELQEKASVFARNAASMAVGGALLLVALMAVGTAVIYGLIVLFDLFLPFEIAVWLGPLAFGAVVGLVGMSMIKKGKERMASEGLVPQRTLDTLREDKDWLKSKVR